MESWSYVSKYIYLSHMQENYIIYLLKYSIFYIDLIFAIKLTERSFYCKMSVFIYILDAEAEYMQKNNPFL